MSESLKGCKFEHNKLSIHFESFNDECAIVKEAKDANMLSQELKLTRVNLQLNWCSSISTTPVLKRGFFFNTLKLIETMTLLGHTTSLSGYDMQ